MLIWFVSIKANKSHIEYKKRLLKGGYLESKFFYLVFGTVRVVFHWDEEYSFITNALKKYLGVREIHNKEILPDFDLELILSSSMFSDINSRKLYNKVINTRVWDALEIRSKEMPRKWICRNKGFFIKTIGKIIPEHFFRFVNRRYASYSHLIALYFIYDILVNIVQRALLNKNATFLHASAICNSEVNSVLICGQRHIGKTLSSVRFALSKRWRIISDDLIVVDNEANLYTSSLPAHIFGYYLSVLKLPISEEYMFQGSLDKLHWNLYIKFQGANRTVRLIQFPQEWITSGPCKLKLVLSELTMKSFYRK